MKTKLLAGILLLISLNSFAQQTTTVPNDTAWTLMQCIDYAWSNNLLVKRSEYDVEDSKITLNQARLSRLPSVNAQGSHGYSWGRGLDPVSNQFVSQEIKSTSLGANASLPLFRGFNINNSIRQSQNTTEATELDLAKTKNDVALNVASLFINVVFSKEQLENAKYQLSSSQQQLDRTRRQVAAGSLARSEELNLDAQVATNELTVVQQENALALAILQLKQALQIPATQLFDVQIPDIDPEDLLLEQSREEIYSIARQAMPEIKSANLKVESSLYGVKAARGNLLPRLSLEGFIQTNYSSTSEFQSVLTGGMEEEVIGYFGPEATRTFVMTQAPIRETRYFNFGDQFSNNIYRTLNLQLTIPIFNNYQSRVAYQRAQITRERARITQQETDNTLRQNVEMAYNDAVASAKTYNSSQRQVQARDEAYRMVRQRFEIGAANYVEYQVSENDLFRAKTDLLRAKYDFIFKKKVLDFYQGKPITN